MPGDDRIGFDEQEALAPFGPEPGKNQPQNPVRCPKPESSFIGSLQNGELGMPQRADAGVVFRR